MRETCSLVRLQQEVQDDLDRFRLERKPRGVELPPKVSAVLQCIHEDLFDPGLNVKTLKQRCGIQDNNISCLFKFALGATIKDYIDSLRMEAADLLLQNRKLGVLDVAIWVGYEHPATFYRVFQKRFNCTPSVYRRRIVDSVLSSA